MKRRSIPAWWILAALVLLTFWTPMARAEVGTLYPIAVEESGTPDAPRVTKRYQLALTDSPGEIPTADFERDGFRYHLLDMTKENMVGVDTKEYTEAVKRDCKSNDTGEALKLLDAEKAVTTSDGYAGVLLLDHASVKVSVKGYKTNAKNISATRVYANLSDADLDLIPKSITENGNTLTLNDAQWRSETDEDGELRFTATASYSGTSTSRTATGYMVTANYRGTVVKTNCEMIAYTVVFAGEKIPDSPAPELEQDGETESGERETPAQTRTEGETEADTRSDPPFVWRDALSIAGCLSGLAAAAVVLVFRAAEKRKGADRSE